MLFRSWDSISKYRQFLENNDRLDPQRRAQMRAWMWSQISEGLIEALHKEKTMTDLISKTEKDVYEGRLPASTAANKLVQTFLGFKK